MRNIFLYILFVFLIFIISSCSRRTVSSSSANELPASSSDIKSLTQNLFTEVNNYRISIGKEPFQLVEAASAQAEAHSADMASKKVPFGHDGFTARVTAISKITGLASAAAENVAYGQISAKEVLDMWLHSAGHKKNLDGNYNLTGIGLAKDKNGIVFFTQIYLRKDTH